MPAADLYSVQLGSPPQGVVGETLATITSGGLHVDSQYDPDGDGTALVYADSQSDAIRQALTGAVIANLSAVNLPAVTYSFNPTTTTTDTTTHTAAFGLEPTVPLPPPTSPPPTGPTQWKLWLEDLTATPTQSDWDYNDFYWNVWVGVIDPTTIQTVSIVANAPEAVAQPNLPTLASFTVTRDSGPVGVAVTVAYQARLNGDVVSSGSVTIAAGQASATITVFAPPPTIDDPSARPLVVQLLDSSVPTVMLASANRASTMVYAADAVPSVGVRLPEDYLTVADPDAAFTASGALVRDGASVSQPLTVRYQVTSEEGIDGANPVDLGTFTATFAAGEDHAAFTVAVPVSVTPSPDGRVITVTVLPPLPAAPYPYTPEAGNAARVFFHQPKETPVGGLELPNGDYFEFRDASGNAVAELKVSNWENAFKKENNNIVVDKDFIKLDPDRFTLFYKTSHEEIKDQPKWKVTLRSKSYVTQGEKSVLNPNINTWQEEIEYELVPAKSGIKGEFESIRPLILVSNVTDDAKFDAYGIKDGQLNDATIFTKLGDTISVQVDGSNRKLEIAVPVKKVAKLDMISLPKPGGAGATLFTQAEAKEALRLANQVYAPAGIVFER